MILHIDSCFRFSYIVYLEGGKVTFLLTCSFKLAGVNVWISGHQADSMKIPLCSVEMLTHRSFLSQKNLFPSHYSQFLLISHNSSSLLSLWMMSSINRGWSYSKSPCVNQNLLKEEPQTRKGEAMAPSFIVSAKEPSQVQNFWLN